MSIILDFYRGDGTDHAGRTITDILAFTYDDIQSTDDFMPWLFPTSLHFRDRVGWAPMPTESEEKELARDDAVVRRLVEAFSMMMDYYGLAWVRTETGEVWVGQSPDVLATRGDSWLVKGSVEFPRISRILASMVSCGLGDYAEGLLRCLWTLDRTYPGVFTDEERHRWTEAATPWE